MRTLALALAEAHARGIIHRDLKPSNVLISPRRELVIMDFGLARRIEPGDSRLTQAGAILGTPAYMSPEQVAGDAEAIGPACDIYSLGVILYELLTGRLPFEGPRRRSWARSWSPSRRRRRHYRPDLDPRLEAICLKAMAKESRGPLRLDGRAGRGAARRPDRSRDRRSRPRRASLLRPLPAPAGHAPLGSAAAASRTPSA